MTLSQLIQEFVHWYLYFESMSQIARFMGPTWGPPGSCRPQMGPMLAPLTLLSGVPICNIESISWMMPDSKWRCNNETIDWKMEPIGCLSSHSADTLSCCMTRNHKSSTKMSQYGLPTGHRLTISTWHYTNITIIPWTMRAKCDRVWCCANFDLFSNLALDLYIESNSLPNSEWISHMMPDSKWRCNNDETIHWKMEPIGCLSSHSAGTLSGCMIQTHKSSTKTSHQSVAKRL